MSNNAVIETIGLTKKYGDFTAVDSLDLSIGEGEVFGFLGPNGAGKTTTLLMLLGLTEPYAGTAKIAGFNPFREPLKVKRITGYLPEKVGFYEDLTAEENLLYTADLNGIPRGEAKVKIKDLLKTVGLSDIDEKRVGTFSRGMKQRLGFADVFMKEPKVVFLDEPIAGIDPKGIDQVLDLVSFMSQNKITTIISSHQLPQVQRVCTRIGIMSKGKMVVEGAMEMLGRESLAGGQMRVEARIGDAPANLTEVLKKMPGILKVEQSGESFYLTSTSDLRSQISKAIVESGASLLEIKIEKYSLEDIYRKYFKEG